MSNSDSHSAGPQGLGYIYQGRSALLKLMTLPESHAVLIEKDDDLDFVDQDGAKTLGSLKHKSIGDRLTDLSTDFWKSIRIWLKRYKADGKTDSNLRFFLLTTSTVSPSSFLQHFVPNSERSDSLLDLVKAALTRTESALIKSVGAELDELGDREKEDFLSRVEIFGNAPRITDIPAIIADQHMRSVRREFRVHVFERLEGWWTNAVIGLMSGQRTEPVSGFEVSDKLSAIAEEYRSDSLPIQFRGKKPTGGIDAEGDPRLFVTQLRHIRVTTARIQNAILDYYRAFEQRSAWARENVLIAGEVEEYEDRLVEEWGRYREVVFETLDETSSEEVLIEAGKALYNWAELETDHIRIRERVSEPYVVRGGFHILANGKPSPKVYWHPRFLERLATLLEAAP